MKLTSQKECFMLKKYLSAIIVAGAAVLALIFGLILPGASATKEVFGSTATKTVNFLGLVFGGATITTQSGNTTNSITITGGMSIFGLISFLALIAGIALVVVSIFVKGKKFDFIGAICIAVAGIFAFFLLTCGTDITGVTINGTTSNGTAAFTEVYEEFKLGAGAIIYGIVATLGGAFGIVNNFKKLV